MKIGPFLIKNRPIFELFFSPERPFSDLKFGIGYLINHCSLPGRIWQESIAITVLIVGKLSQETAFI